MLKFLNTRAFFYVNHGFYTTKAGCQAIQDIAPFHYIQPVPKMRHSYCKPMLHHSLFKNLNILYAHLCM